MGIRKIALGGWADKKMNNEQIYTIKYGANRITIDSTRRISAGMPFACAKATPVCSGRFCFAGATTHPRPRVNRALYGLSNELWINKTHLKWRSAQFVTAGNCPNIDKIGRNSILFDDALLT